MFVWLCSFIFIYCCLTWTGGGEGGGLKHCSKNAVYSTNAIDMAINAYIKMFSSGWRKRFFRNHSRTSSSDSKSPEIWFQKCFFFSTSFRILKDNLNTNWFDLVFYMWSHLDICSGIAFWSIRLREALWHPICVHILNRTFSQKWYLNYQFRYRCFPIFPVPLCYQDDLLRLQWSKCIL